MCSSDLKRRYVLELDTSSTKEALKTVSDFNKRDYQDEVTSYIEKVTEPEDVDKSPSEAKQMVLTMLKTIKEDLENYNKKHIDTLEKAFKVSQKAITDRDTPPDEMEQKLLQALGKAVLKYRKSVLYTVKECRKAINNILTLGYRIESIGKKSK